MTTDDTRDRMAAAPCARCGAELDASDHGIGGSHAWMPIGALLASALMAANYPGDSGEDVDRLIAEMERRGLRLSLADAPDERAAAIRAEAGTLDVEMVGLAAALNALADLQVEAGHVVNEVVRARIDALVERVRAGIRYEAWGRSELIAAVDEVLTQEEGADPLPEDEWDPAFIRLREARARLAGAER